MREILQFAMPVVLITPLLVIYLLIINTWNRVYRWISILFIFSLIAMFPTVIAFLEISIKRSLELSNDYLAFFQRGRAYLIWRTVRSYLFLLSILSLGVALTGLGVEVKRILPVRNKK